MSMIHIQSETTKSKATKVNTDVDVQPNAIDIRLDSVRRIDDTERFEISEDHKKHRGSYPIEPDENGYFVLDEGSYEVVMENEIVIAQGESGFVITRSTLNRNGCFLTSGLYDSGYGIDVETNEDSYGVIAAVLHVRIDNAAIKKGTRVGQFLLFSAETVGLYDGDYGNDKQHDQQYIQDK